MTKYFLICLLLLFTNLTSGQQIPLYSQYYYNPMLYNPALTGINESPNIFLFHRSQWKNMPGAPEATNLTVDGLLKNKKIGLGGNIYNYTGGFMERLGVNAFYSYRINLSEYSNFRFGFSLGIANNQIDFSQAVIRDLDDPFVLAGSQRKTAVDASAGLVYLWKNTELGFAIPQLLGNSYEYASNNLGSAYKLTRNYLISAKQIIFINKEKNITAFPLIVFRFVPGVPVQFDVNAVLGLKDKFWLGISVRSSSSYGLNARIKIHNALNIGYAYGFSTTELGTYAGPSHEIMLGFTFNGSNKKEDELMDKQQKKVEALSKQIEFLTEKLLAIEAQLNLLNKNNESTKHLKDEIDALTLLIAELKKDSSSSVSSLKLQIAILEEKVNLLVKLIGN